MKKWQRLWLIFLISYAILHVVRDIFQDLGVRNFLSMILVKKIPQRPSLYIGGTFNTYVIAILMTILAIKCLKINKFGKTGFTTIFIATFVLIAWLFYWFFL